MQYLKMLFGAISVLLGLAIYAWILYNYFYPTKEVESSTGSYFLPLAMIMFGGKWMKDSIREIMISRSAQ